MNKRPITLSKTRLMHGLQCHKALYYDLYQPKLAAPITDDQQALFDQGREVGELAREKFPGGTLIDAPPWDWDQAIRKTRAELDAGANTIYEAAFGFDRFFCRVDILHRSDPMGRWSVIEVKSTTSVKEDHISDVAIQCWILSRNNMELEGAHVMHINNLCRYPELENLFTLTDVTQQIRDAYPTVTKKMGDLYSVATKGVEPQIPIGPYCVSPYDCAYKNHCWKNVPEKSIFELPGKVWPLYEKNFLKIADVPADLLDEKQKRAQKAVIENQRLLAPNEMKEILNWQYPLYYLDFETASPAIPRYDGVGPYKHTPFQFSLHVQEKPGDLTDIKETAYLHADRSDPRRPLAEALIDSIGPKGSIVAYNSKFEGGVLKELAEFMPEHKRDLLAIESRLVDPLPLLRLAVYDPAQKGSYSIKAIGPALLGHKASYEGMNVPDGGAAQRAFEEMIAPKTSPSRKEFLYNALLEYCRKDSRLMIDLVEWMRGELLPR